MGTIRSFHNVKGMVINGVLLGDPVELDNDPATFEYDHSKFPNGEIINVTWEEYDEEGNGIGIPSGDLVIDEVEEINEGIDDDTIIEEEIL